MYNHLTSNNKTKKRKKPELLQWKEKIVLLWFWAFRSGLVSRSWEVTHSRFPAMRTEHRLGCSGQTHPCCREEVVGCEDPPRRRLQRSPFSRGARHVHPRAPVLRTSLVPAPGCSCTKYNAASLPQAQTQPSPRGTFEKSPESKACTCNYLHTTSCIQTCLPDTPY